MRRSKRIASQALGGLLTIACLGCQTRPMERPTPAAPAVVELKETPSTDLLQCAQKPEGFSPTWVASMPPEVRWRFVQLAELFRINNEAHDRLVNWLSPGSCSDTANP